jgi:hypothetical protein
LPCGKIATVDDLLPAVGTRALPADPAVAVALELGPLALLLQDPFVKFLGFLFHTFGSLLGLESVSHVLANLI